MDRTRSSDRMDNTIRDWPANERPREKLFRHGEAALCDSELLAIILSTGSRGESAIDLARGIMAEFGAFRNMSHTDARAWKTFKGLGQAKLARIKASLEIGKRMVEEKVKDNRNKIRSSREVFEIVMPRLRDLKKEVFKVVMLNPQNRIIDIADLEEGTVDQAYPIKREIFHQALQHFAASIICVHNHPSGECQPSEEDIAFTRDLVSCGTTLEVQVLDHLIIGSSGYFSFKDEKLID